MESFVIEMQDKVCMPAGACVKVIAVGVEASASSTVAVAFGASSAVATPNLLRSSNVPALMCRHFC